MNAVIQANGSRFITAGTRGKLSVREAGGCSSRCRDERRELSRARCAFLAAALRRLRCRGIAFRNRAGQPRLREAMPLPRDKSHQLCSQPSQIPSKRRKVDRPFCFQRAWHVLWFTELINLPWAAPFNDCSINNKFPGSCLKVYRVCALSGEPRAF